MSSTSKLSVLFVQAWDMSLTVTTVTHNAQSFVRIVFYSPLPSP